MTPLDQPERRRRVLVSGASIAGPALVYWLRRYGFECTVVEAAKELRTGGQNIDVRGAGREVARRMHLEEAIRAATTGERGLQFVDGEGRVHAAFPAGHGDSDGATAELEILRGDLAKLLYDATERDATYVFGDRITAIEEVDEEVRVRFEHGEPRTYDLVVAADGIRSSTRALLLGHSVPVKFLGMYTTYFTVPRASTDTEWWQWYNAPGGRAITLRPDRVGTTRATLSFLSSKPGYEELDRAAQQQLLQRTFADAGWQAPRLLAALEGLDDWYFDAVGQVDAPTWGRGRAVCVGDAAYCPSPISGMGTSLALVGAYVLAGELAAHADHREALRAYERILRPYVEEAQALPPGTPRLANPKSRLGIRALLAAAKLAASPPARWLAARLASSPKAEAIELPDYTRFEAPGAAAR